MQHHHPGSWYLPWGVPLQKMMAVPMHHPGAVSYHQSQQPLQVPNQTPQQHQQHQQQPHQTYQHQMHPALQHHNPAALHQQLHPAAAAAMFTPLSLRTFINPSANHLSLSQQQQLATAVQQSPNPPLQSQSQTQLGAINLNVGVVPIRQNNGPGTISPGTMMMPVKKVSTSTMRVFFLNIYLERTFNLINFSEIISDIQHRVIFCFNGVMALTVDDQSILINFVKISNQNSALYQHVFFFHFVCKQYCCTLIF